MTNPIPSSTLWVTPNSVDELFAMLNQYTGEQKALALHVAMMTMNTCSRLVDQAAAEETV
jgi:hypothetical protein